MAGTWDFPDSEKSRQLMIKAYLYPIVKYRTNPYIDEFIGSISSSVEVCNANKPSGTGIFNVFRYLGKIDIIILNWIEDIPDKRGGYLQSVALLTLVLILKFTKIKVLYTLHNRESHYQTSRFVKNFLMSVLVKNADYILCHSSEGMEVLKKWNVPIRKFQYHPHPFYTNQLITSAEIKEYDILIWGTIKPYKGVDKFLKYLETKKMLSRYKIKIAGKTVPASYEDELSPYLSESVKLENRFMDENSLNELIDKSRIILFTYEESSILSSGAVVYSLGRGATVIGPNVASFGDLHKEGLIKVFNNFDELISQIDTTLDKPGVSHERISSYIEKNTWAKFGQRIIDWIKNTN